MKDIKTFVLFCKNKGLDAKDTKTLDLFMNNSVFQNTRSGDFVLEDELQLQWSAKCGCYVRFRLQKNYARGVRSEWQNNIEKTLLDTDDLD